MITYVHTTVTISTRLIPSDQTWEVVWLVDGGAELQLREARVVARDALVVGVVVEEGHSPGAVTERPTPHIGAAEGRCAEILARQPDALNMRAQMLLALLNNK